MLDAIADPLAVISSDYVVRRANKAYTTLVGCSFADAIGQKCYTLLRRRVEPCADCRMQKAIEEDCRQTIEQSPHPSGTGALCLGFSPCTLDTVNPPLECIIEHIRDISLLEQLKSTLEKKNSALGQTMRNLKQAQRSIHEDLRLARQIQEGILPTHPPEFTGFRIASTYRPVADVGGDLYDFLPFSPDTLGIFIGDASGHGLAASLIGTISKMSLFHHSKQVISPQNLIAAINRDLFATIQTNHYLTCFIGIFDRRKRSFTYSRAGHPIPLVIRADGSVVHLKSSGTFAGVIENTSFEESVFQYKKGDRFYLFTDGIYEIQKGDENYISYDNFVSMLQEMNSLPFDSIIPALKERFLGYTYLDDYTIIVIDVTDDAGCA
ncbi:MAG: SpoIIE family protein phosphatase, partial [Chitinispirillaceae bacterium]|jgi:serine phosphatase RsbU (regulator of sigma subunit)|nr:SpoIIE family protein phosphatase [Chitinispirillaceae bacterium]